MNMFVIKQQFSTLVCDFILTSKNRSFESWGEVVAAAVVQDYHFKNSSTRLELCSDDSFFVGPKNMFGLGLVYSTSINLFALVDGCVLSEGKFMFGLHLIKKKGTNFIL